MSPSRHYSNYLLRKDYPRGHNSCWLEFRIEEFKKADQRGKRKPLHIHVVFKKGGGTLLEIFVPSLKIKEENEHTKEGDRKAMKKFIKKNLNNIMSEIKKRLTSENISLNE
jgi:hypothetical protein